MYKKYKLKRTIKVPDQLGKKYYQDGVNAQGLEPGFITEEMFEKLDQCSQGKVQILTMNGDKPQAKPVQGETTQAKVEAKVEEPKIGEKKNLIETVKSEYRKIIGKEPHHLKSVDTLKQDIAKAKQAVIKK